MIVEDYRLSCSAHDLEVLGSYPATSIIFHENFRANLFGAANSWAVHLSLGWSLTKNVITRLEPKIRLVDPRARAHFQPIIWPWPSSTSPGSFHQQQLGLNGFTRGSKNNCISKHLNRKLWQRDVKLLLPEPLFFVSVKFLLLVWQMANQFLVACSMSDLFEPHLLQLDS